MKNHLKFFSLSLLAAALLFTMLPLSQAQTSNLTDLDPSDPSLEAIESLEDSGVIHGYPDGTFKSTNKINRAEFMKIVVEAYTDSASGANCFPDVGTEWFAKYVCTAKDLGVVSGYPDGTFKPAQEINFAEASKIVNNIYELNPEIDLTAAVWYEPYVEALAEVEAIPTSIGDFDKSIARGEMAEVVWRVSEEITDKDSLSYDELNGDPVAVNSCEEFKDLFLDHPEPIYYIAEGDGAEPPAAADDSGETASAPDYSETNVQVSGVDESDIVKNDGEYIYTLKDDSVRIVKAYPATEMAEVANLDYSDTDFYPSYLFLNTETEILTVVGTDMNFYIYDFGFDTLISPYYHEDRTSVYTYDVSDPSNPVSLRTLSFDGSYSESRMINGTLYLVLNKFDYSYYVYGYDPVELNVEEVLPRYHDSKTNQEELLVDCTDILYLPRERDLNYLITLAIPTTDPAANFETEVLMGYSENIYASTENLYVAATNYDYGDYYYDPVNVKTLIHRFDLSPTGINLEASGKVPGWILNQFSMDEHENHFRIASTVDNWVDPEYNNLYVLDMDLDQTGAVENIATGESIYSTRFMGDRGFMVTFEKIDPLFAFDLSDPNNPRLVGELEIPGYSDYLHPYDANHLIGFGKDTEDPTAEQQILWGQNFSWYQGMKIALFDVSDLTNPKQIFSAGIGDRGTESPLLYDHKALLFDKAKELLAFPVSVAVVKDEDAPPETYGEITFQGAYVYDLNLTDGFTLNGSVSHYGEGELDLGYWYGYDFTKDIQRVLYIGDSLYTVSSGYIKASDLNTLEEQNLLVLP